MSISVLFKKGISRNRNFIVMYMGVNFSQIYVLEGKFLDTAGR